MANPGAYSNANANADSYSYANPHPHPDTISHRCTYEDSSANSDCHTAPAATSTK